MQTVKQQILNNLLAAEQLLAQAKVDADLLTADVNADVFAELQEKFADVANAVAYYVD
jgi:hypothetical protein